MRCGFVLIQQRQGKFIVSLVGWIAHLTIFMFVGTVGVGTSGDALSWYIAVSFCWEIFLEVVIVFFLGLRAYCACKCDVALVSC